MLLLWGAFTLSPSTGFSPALCHHGLCLRLQKEVFPCRPASAGSTLDRIAGLLALETSDLQRQPLLVGLLDEASIEPDKPLAWHPALRVGIWRMVIPASFRLVGSQTTPVDAVHPNNVSRTFLRH